MTDISHRRRSLGFPTDSDIAGPPRPLRNTTLLIEDRNRSGICPANAAILSLLLILKFENIPARDCTSNLLQDPSLLVG
jgi:hypothetical protein